MNWQTNIIELDWSINSYYAVWCHNASEATIKDMGKSVYTLSQQKYSIKLWGWLASERWKLSAFITKGIYRFRYFQCLPVFIIRPTIMLWRVSSVRPSVRSSVRLSVNIWLFTGVITCRITFNFADIIHLVWPIHDAGNEPWSPSNMRILTQLLIFTCWSFLKPFCKLEPSNLVQLKHWTH